MDLFSQIPDQSVDLIVTDPPYHIDNTDAGSNSKLSKRYNSLMGELQDSEIVSGFDLRILDEMVRVMRKINIYIWCNGKQIPMYIDYFVKKLGCAFDILVWIKTNAAPLFNNKYLTDKEYCLYFRRGGIVIQTIMREQRQHGYSPQTLRIRGCLGIRQSSL